MGAPVFFCGGKRNLQIEIAFRDDVFPDSKFCCSLSPENLYNASRKNAFYLLCTLCLINVIDVRILMDMRLNRRPFLICLFSKKKSNYYYCWFVVVVIVMVGQKL